MATDHLLDGEFQFNDENLETFTLIWLDGEINSVITEDIRDKIQTFINHIKKFADKNACQQYIEQRREDDRLIIIVSGSLGRQLVPNIHKLRQVLSIYVYCMNKKAHEEWACKFSKVRLSLKNFIFIKNFL
jgi:hypothetical protein